MDKITQLGIFREWDQPEDEADVSKVIEMYQRGYAGALYNPEAQEQFEDGLMFTDGEDVCREFGYEDTAKGELVFPVAAIQDSYRQALPGPGQVVGDCVSHSQKNANLLTLCTEAISGVPDPVTGKLEELPQVSNEAERNGVLSTEAIYFYRSTKPGHGWFCPEAARVSQNNAGCVLRKKYGDLDLTLYGKDSVNAFNRLKVPDELGEVFDDHIIREATNIRGNSAYEQLRDLLARGFGVSSCGSEGFASTRNEHGVSKRSGRWAHAMAYLAVDDRSWAHRAYGCGLVLVQNSWAIWNKGVRKVKDTADLLIPKGAFWAKWTDVARRTMIAMAGALGWARQKLPNYLAKVR